MLTEGGVLTIAREASDVQEMPGPTPSIWVGRDAEPNEASEKSPDGPLAPTADEAGESPETEPDCIETELYCELI